MYNDDIQIVVLTGSFLYSKELSIGPYHEPD
jgi:hypothetical protein